MSVEAVVQPEELGELPAAPPGIDPARTVLCSVCGWRYLGDGKFTCCPRYLSHPKLAAAIAIARGRHRLQSTTEGNS